MLVRYSIVELLMAFEVSAQRERTIVRGEKLCDRFKDASVIRTIARHRVTFTKIFYAHH